MYFQMEAGAEAEPVIGRVEMLIELDPDVELGVEVEFVLECALVVLEVVVVGVVF